MCGLCPAPDSEFTLQWSQLQFGPGLLQPGLCHYRVGHPMSDTPCHVPCAAPQAKARAHSWCLTMSYASALRVRTTSQSLFKHCRASRGHAAVCGQMASSSKLSWCRPSHGEASSMKVSEARACLFSEDSFRPVVSASRSTLPHRHQQHV
jgi:hypothetical protein